MGVRRGKMMDMVKGRVKGKDRDKGAGGREKEIGGYLLRRLVIGTGTMAAMVTTAMGTTTIITTQDMGLGLGIRGGTREEVGSCGVLNRGRSRSLEGEKVGVVVVGMRLGGGMVIARV